jgi:hypothetical protein
MFAMVFKYFKYFCNCFKHMLFYVAFFLYVTSVASKCFKSRVLHMGCAWEARGGASGPVRARGIQRRGPCVDARKIDCSRGRLDAGVRPDIRALAALREKIWNMSPDLEAIFETIARATPTY